MRRESKAYQAVALFTLVLTICLFCVFNSIAKRQLQDRANMGLGECQRCGAKCTTHDPCACPPECETCPDLIAQIEELQEKLELVEKVRAARKLRDTLLAQHDEGRDGVYSEDGYKKLGIAGMELERLRALLELGK